MQYFTRVTSGKEQIPLETIPSMEFIICMSNMNNLGWCIPTDFVSKDGSAREGGKSH